MKYYELDLPSQYMEIAHVKFDKIGFLYDIKAVFPGLLLTMIGWIFVKPTISQILISLGILVISIYPYFILHEIIHGTIIKIITRQRVKIGFNKSGAYCGMPEIYMYRTVAVCCTVAPLVVFLLVFGFGIAILIVASNWMFLPFGLLLILHLLSCRSDVNLLKELGKYKKHSLLVKDIGNEQWFYLFREEE